MRRSNKKLHGQVERFEVDPLARQDNLDDMISEARRIYEPPTPEQRARFEALLDAEFARIRSEQK